MSGLHILPKNINLRYQYLKETFFTYDCVLGICGGIYCANINCGIKYHHDPNVYRLHILHILPKNHNINYQDLMKTYFTCNCGIGTCGSRYCANINCGLKYKQIYMVEKGKHGELGLKPKL